MSALPVSPEKKARLAHRLAIPAVRETDSEEPIVRAGGHGGEHAAIAIRD